MPISSAKQDYLAILLAFSPQHTSLTMNLLILVSSEQAENLPNHQVLDLFCLTVLPSISLFPLTFYQKQETRPKLQYFVLKTPQLSIQVHCLQVLLSTLMQDTIQLGFIQQRSPFPQLPITCSSFPSGPSPEAPFTGLLLVLEGIPISINIVFYNDIVCIL